MISNKTGLILFLLALIILPGCSLIVYKAAYPTLNDGKYDSEFPYKGSSSRTGKLENQLHCINSMAFYKAYIFNPGYKC